MASHLPGLTRATVGPGDASSVLRKKTKIRSLPGLHSSPLLGLATWVVISGITELECSESALREPV